MTKKRVDQNPLEGRPQLDIFAYHDFRFFLAEYQKAWHALNPRVTGAWLGEQLGLPRSRTYYSAVIKGKRITNTFIERFVALFAFKPAQAKYFQTLVNFNQAVDPDISRMMLVKLMTLKSKMSQVIESDSYAYYTDWRHAVVRAMLDIHAFKGDCESLARKIFPPVTPGEVRKSIELLLSLNLISKDNHGFYKPTSKSITTGEFVKNSLIKQYQQEVLDLAKRSLLEETRLRKNNYTNCISVSENALQQIEEKISQFKEDIREITHHDVYAAEYVYHINLNLIPSAK